MTNPNILVLCDDTNNLPRDEEKGETHFQTYVRKGAPEFEVLKKNLIGITKRDEIQYFVIHNIIDSDGNIESTLSFVYENFYKEYI